MIVTYNIRFIHKYDVILLLRARSCPFLASCRPRSSGALVEKIVDLACGLRADPGHFGQIGERRALDRLERPEMMQQRALARGADAGDFLQPSLPDIAAAADCAPAE